MPFSCRAVKGEVTYSRRNRPWYVATHFPATAESHADVPQSLGKPRAFTNLVFSRKRDGIVSLVHCFSRRLPFYFYHLLEFPITEEIPSHR